MKFLITGANGFIGRGLCTYLSNKNYPFVPVVRKPSDILNALLLTDQDDFGWHQALVGCDTVIHLAGQAFAKKNDAAALLELKQSNIEFALVTCRRAIKAGVKRFVFLSSAKVHGEKTSAVERFTPEDPMDPKDPYAVSKVEAEQKLQELVKDTDIELVIVRPPLVYGPGVKGNFASILTWVQKGIPLPLSAANNQRSMVGIENLSSFIALCSDRSLSPRAANQSFFVSDGKPLSTAEMLRLIAYSFNTKVKLFYVPLQLMRLALDFIGKSSIADRLFGSFVLDDTKSFEFLGWTPPVTMVEQLQRMYFVKTD